MFDVLLAGPAVESLSAALSSLAYLDPGTGSYALQILLATLFGGLFALKQSWSGVKAWFASTGAGRPDRAS